MSSWLRIKLLTAERVVTPFWGGSLPITALERV
jgi:hypothetical protein